MLVAHGRTLPCHTYTLLSSDSISACNMPHCLALVLGDLHTPFAAHGTYARALVCHGQVLADQGANRREGVRGKKGGREIFACLVGWIDGRSGFSKRL
ncbi:hypothetical protein L484_016773 [Morus notabilis]|uniref:Uncharacterized protein n=1 Tax=Morus notabilis TaxID=981085 RepID=W9ST84_9ROSA|nr:hypothetical protein L484_016773 [Morus notabilis]